MTDENFIEIPIRNSGTLIKVVGVGGGGGNAVANMQHEGMYDVSMLVCNSDAKALEDSPITDRLQIGPGLGCGGNPNEGKRLAEEHLADIYDSIDPETKMVFITAGMGGRHWYGGGAHLRTRNESAQHLDRRSRHLALPV